MNKQKAIAKQRRRRKFSVRKRLRGTARKPRMCVFRSSTHIACQLIDDSIGQTLVSAGTRDRAIRDQIPYGGNREAAKIVGQIVGQRAAEAGIKEARFDRGWYKYHGRVAALADAAREAGLAF
ncbi:MAG: 50S ribosomal protein L18 [Planctomycetota bacterium]